MPQRRQKRCRRNFAGRPSRISKAPAQTGDNYQRLHDGHAIVWQAAKSAK
jgi:hypothetical protein